MSYIGGGPEPLLEEAGVGDQQCPDPVHRLRTSSRLDGDAQSVSYSLRRPGGSDGPRGGLHGLSDVVGLVHPAAVQAARRRDVGVDCAAVDRCQIQNILDPPVLFLAGNAIVRLRFMDLYEGLQVVHQPLVVGLQRLQYLADRLVALRTCPLQRNRDVLTFFDYDGHDDVPKVLALGSPHHSAHGLHDVDLALLAVQECDAREVGDVDALAEQSAVADDSAIGFPPWTTRVSQSIELELALSSGRRRVQMDGVDRGARFGPTVFPPEFSRRPGLDEFVCQSLRVPLRSPDGIGECQSPVEPSGRALPGSPPCKSVDGERHAHHPQEFVYCSVLARQLAHALRECALVNTEHDDAVVGQHAGLDGLLEWQSVQLRAVHVLVGHVGDCVVSSLCSGFRSRVVHPRRRRHVEPLTNVQPVGVVESLEVDLALVETSDRLLRSGRPVGLVGHREVELDRGLADPRAVHLVKRLVGREDHLHFGPV